MRWALLAVLIPGALWLTGALQRFARYDPFAQYRTEEYLNALGPDVGSRLGETVVRVYEGVDLGVQFAARRIDVRRDRTKFTVFDIHNGRLYDGGEQRLWFSAGVGVYDTVQNRAEVFGGLALWNRELAFRTDRGKVDTGRRFVRSIGGITGRLRDGDFAADRVSWNYAVREGRAEKVLWRGPMQQQGKTRRVQLRGQTWEILSNPRRQIFYKAEAVDEDQFIRAEKITWLEAEDVVTAEGAVEYVGPDAIIRAPKVVVYRKEERAVATGGVQLLVKPEREKGRVGPPPGGLPPAQPVLPPGVQQPPASQEQGQEERVRRSDNLRDYPILVTAERIEYWYTEGSRRAQVSGSLKARQELAGGGWREITAPKALYDQEREVLTLLSSTPGAQEVRLKNSQGDDFVAEEVEISTVEGNESVRGKNVSGVMPVRESEVRGGRGGSGGGGGER
ncbi:MAG: hypothetical protein C4341_08310 [Armatimonadota bacterium]